MWSSYEEELTKRCLEGMLKLPHIHILGSTDETEKTGVISFTIDGVHPHDAATILDSYGTLSAAATTVPSRWEPTSM